MSLISTLSGRKKAGLSAAFAMVVVAALNGAAANAAVIFSDTFGSGSTVNAASNIAPTSSATSYQPASTKNSPTPTIAAGDLHIGLASTTSGIIETQALFTASPVALQNAGDFVDYRLTFTNNNIGISGNNDTLYFGLFNSANSAPVNGLLSSGLSTSATTAVTGGVAGWQGYVWQLAPASTSSTGKTITRPAQSSTNNSNQDLVGNNAGGGTFNTPTGATIGSNFVNASAAGIANSTVFTEDLTITLNADGSQTIANNFYQGADTTGTLIANQSVSTATPIVTSFDGLVFGWRHNIPSPGAGSASAMDVSNITISSNVSAGPATPEPATAGVMVLGALTLLTRRRKA